MSLFTDHVKRWENCELCDLCKTRKNVVLARGTIPCDILMVGEAPGFGEDAIGQAFIGPAGKLLDQIIKQADPEGDWDYAFTNLIACIPKETLNRKVTEPPEDAILACKERLQEIIDICQPSLLIAVGEVADRHIAADLKIIHPAAILRMDVSQKGLAFQRAVEKLSEAFDELPPF